MLYQARNGRDTIYSSLERSRLTSGEPTIARRETTNTGVSMFGSGVMLLTYFTAAKTEAIAQLRLWSGGTAAAATPTLVRAGIYTEDSSGNLTLAAAIASDTALFAATNTAYTRSLTSTLAKIVGQRYAVGILVVSGAALPTLVGNFFHQGTEDGQAPRLSGQVTGQTDLPASVAVGSIGDNARNVYTALLP